MLAVDRVTLRSDRSEIFITPACAYYRAPLGAAYIPLLKELHHISRSSFYKDFAPTGLKAVACGKQEAGKDARAPQPGMAALRVPLRAHDDGI